MSLYNEIDNELNSCSFIVEDENDVYMIIRNYIENAYPELEIYLDDTDFDIHFEEHREGPNKIGNSYDFYIDDNLNLHFKRLYPEYAL
jgi:hypothetical protein